MLLSRSCVWYMYVVCIYVVCACWVQCVAAYTLKQEVHLYCVCMRVCVCVVYMCSWIYAQRVCICREHLAIYMYRLGTHSNDLMYVYIRTCVLRSCVYCIYNTHNTCNTQQHTVTHTYIQYTHERKTRVLMYTYIQQGAHTTCIHTIRTRVLRSCV